MANRRTKKTPAQPPRRARTGNALVSAISEQLRGLGGILGNAYADGASVETIAGLEGAKTALLEARRTAQSDE